MLSFESAITTFTPEERATIRALLKTWRERTRLGKAIARNLDSLEHFLPPYRMRKLLQAILSSPQGDMQALASAYQRECCDHTLQGGEIAPYCRPQIVGRAVEKEIFIEHLYKNSEYFGHRDEAADLVRRLIEGEEPEGQERLVPLSKHAAWVTWNESDSTQDPFTFAVDSAEKIRCCLGMDPNRRFLGPLLLLVYDWSPQRRLIRPTVADAGLFIFFEPPPVDFEDHGWTRPWDSGLGSKLGSYEPQPRPEAIHEPVTTDLLLLPVRERM